MNHDEKSLLDKATQALKGDVPDTKAIVASAERSASALDIAIDRDAFGLAIRNCEDVQKLFAAYRAGSLPQNRKLLVDAHLGDCGECLRLFSKGRDHAALDWSAPAMRTVPERRPARLAWAFAATAAALVIGLFLYRAYWQVPPGVRAEVQSIDGSAYLIGEGGDRRIAAGAQLREGDELRTTGQSHAILRLADGSLVEVNQRSALGVGARGHNMTVRLNRGAVIVQAAHRTSGHLYLKTPDCRVAVTGTIFSVDAGIKGSRVAVLQGSVNVAHAGINAMLHPGDQLSTSDNLAPEPLDAQFAWSSEREKYVGIMAQLANVEHSIAQIPFPQPRYSSDLLPHMPADTQLYVSIPNLGDFLEQANTVFQNQLNASPELRDWWTRGHARNPDELNQLVTKIHDVSQYLGDEVVVIGAGQADNKTIALLADVTKSGLKDELQQIAGDANKLTVLDPSSLASADSSLNAGKGVYALVRDHEVVFAHDIAALKKLNAQLDAAPSGFAGGDFGKQIAAAYSRGAGIILGANLQAMFQAARQATGASQKQRGLESTGLADVRYLIAEHRETNGVPANHLNLQFTGARQRMASWLASPGPIGSLDFVSPSAAAAAATLTKDPAAIADDLMAMASQAGGHTVDWSQVDEKLQIDVRNDLIANLGGDFTLAIDGPVLPTPSWKMVVEVNDPAALESALERMTQAMRNQVHDPKAHALAIEPNTVNSATFYTVRDLTAGTAVAEYTFADGFMVLGPNRAIVMDALKTHASGNSLVRSTAFRASLPRDENENYSAVAYQNLGPVLTPLLSQLTGETAEAVRKLAADSRPTVICAWGSDNRIEAASDSRLFGFDFLTLGAILNSRNKPAAQNVLP
jgi:ferric-dicitrate binding protein FerR (iron transport regulator)